MSSPRHSGKVVGHADSPKPVSMGARFLHSCGLKVGRLSYIGGGWYSGECVDRDTGEPRGMRWIRSKASGGFEIRKEAP